MRLYVSGPMTGIPEHNYPAFREAAKVLREARYDVLDPSELGVDPVYSWEDYLRRDLELLLKCDGVATLPGWQNSRGADLECYVARKLGMTVDSVDHWLYVALLKKREYESL